MNRWIAGSWAIGLGLLTGSIAGTLAPAATLDEELRQVVGLSIVFVPTLYVVLVRRWDHWRSINGYVRFAIYLLSIFVASGVLMRVAVLVLGPTGAVARAGTFLAAVAAFLVAVWVTFGGGAELVWDELLEREIIEW